jgi:hypothetical protein
MPNDGSRFTLTNQSESFITTDGQSASLSWNKAPIWGLRLDLDYCQTAATLLWGVLSDDRTGLSFAIATCPRQRSHSRVRVPWDLRPYFTVSDSRLSFSSPPTTRRVTVEVFDPASTRDTLLPCKWRRYVPPKPQAVSELHGVTTHVTVHIVTYSGFAWLIIMSSGLDDWIYWHFFTITVNYDESLLTHRTAFWLLLRMSWVLCSDRRSAGQSVSK